ncbi:MAG: hypothetical protein M3O09_00045, partial [Acidobacteriota bacterium]|nr:hypothetical protein [Acidobacteriota bacterium]
MRTRCSKCDYENDSQYHYCGMCGELLPETVSNPAPKPVRADIPVASPREEARGLLKKYSAVDDRNPFEERAVIFNEARLSPASRPLSVASTPVAESTPNPTAEIKPAPSNLVVESSPLAEAQTTVPLDVKTSNTVPLYQHQSPVHTTHTETARLDAQPRVADTHASTVSGPSFLGLSNEPTNENFQYLLEDPDGDSHRGKYLVLFLLIAIGLGLGWQWKHGAFPFAGRETQTAASGSPTSPSSSGNMSASPSEVAPAMSNTGESDPHPRTGVGEPSRPETKKTAESKPGNSRVPMPTDQEVGSSMPPASESQAKPAQGKLETEQQEKPAKAEVADATPAPAHKAAPEKLTEKPVASREPQPRVSPASRTVVEQYRRPAAASQDDALAADGEKYLYGHGVPQNCNRAQKDLLSAGQGTSAKAQSMLGAMYATGHCATRNL